MRSVKYQCKKKTYLILRKFWDLRNLINGGRGWGLLK